MDETMAMEMADGNNELDCTLMGVDAAAEAPMLSCCAFMRSFVKRHEQDCGDSEFTC